MAHVLIADSSEDVAELFVAALSRRGFATEIRACGTRPVHLPDVLVVDVELRDAADIVEQLRARAPHVAVVATGIRSPEDARPPLGALAYLAKPFALADLTAVVTAAVPT
jgi:DNA-binding response OmpR family regulator